MRKIAILLISIAGALTMGLIWTVGQTGLSDTNAHLCELLSRYLPDVSENCQASDWIVRIAGYLFIIAISISILEIIWIVSKRSHKPQERNRTTYGPQPDSLKSDKAILEVRSGDVAPYYWARLGREFYFRIGVYNAGPKVAENVQVTLHKATKPRCLTRGLSRDNFPYRVVRAGAEWGADRNLINSIKIEDVRINPLSQELFDVAHTWVSSQNELIVDKIDTKINGKLYCWSIEQDERLDLQYEVPAANANAVTFQLAIYVREGAVNVERVAWSG